MKTEKTEAKRVEEQTEPAAMEPRLVRLNELGKLIHSKRKADGLTLEEAARQIRVSLATLWRLERQGSDKNSEADKPLPQPDTRTIASVTRWLGVPIERFVEQSVIPTDGSITHYEGETIPDIVEAHLRADRKLDEDAAAALGRMFRLAYDQFQQMRPSVENTQKEETEAGQD